MVLLAMVMLLGWTAALAALAEDERAAAVREAAHTLTRAGVGTDGPALLQFFKQRTLSAAKGQEIAQWVQQLGCDKFQKRETAAVRLREIGEAVRPQLVRAVSHPDPEIGRRADLLLRKIPADREQEHATAALQLLAYRNPPGAAAALLDYVPCIADERVVEAARAALGELVLRAAKADPAVTAALTDASALKRSMTAEALCRAGRHVPAALKAARDLPASLRLPAALALVEGRNPQGVPWLIDLLTELPAQDIWRAEEMLCRLAGEHAPEVTPDRSTSAVKLQESWRAWWREHGAALDLAAWVKQPPVLGYTLIAQADKGAQGRVFELGPGDKKVKWEIDDLRYPVDARVIGPNRVLIAEYLNRRVTERDFAGKILWEYAVDLPIACQRLANGNTFIATRRQLVEVTRDGKEVFAYHPAMTSIAAAQKLRNGQVVVVIGTQCQRLEAGTTRVLHSFPVGLVYNLGGNVEVLPNGHVLVPEYRNHKVVEYDAAGKACASLTVRSPTSVTRLANGHTLVVSLLQQCVLEFDRDGTEVSSLNTNGRAWRVRRR